MIFSPQAPDPARPGQCGHRFSQRASSSAALVTQTRQSGEWYIQFNTLAALLIARQLPTYKTNEAKITNQFGIDSAPATMTHRLFLGPSNQSPRLSQKTNQSVSGPNDQFWIFCPFFETLALNFFVSVCLVASTTTRAEKLPEGLEEQVESTIIDPIARLRESPTQWHRNWTRFSEEVIPGSPGEDYPIYSSPPETSFSCDGFSRGACPHCDGRQECE